MWKVELFDVVTDLYVLYDEGEARGLPQALLNELESRIQQADAVISPDCLSGLYSSLKRIFSDYPDLLVLDQTAMLRDKLNRENSLSANTDTINLDNTTKAECHTKTAM